jgi:hypothetical protein
MAQGVNTQAVPPQILKTGIAIDSTTLSPNSQQLAVSIGVMPVLARIQSLRGRVAELRGQTTLESLEARLELNEARQQAMDIIDGANFDGDFVMAEIVAEQNICGEVQSTLAAARDKIVNRSNQVAYITNGALWALGEAYTIPSWKRPKYAIPSGTIGIVAGMVPSIASMYAMYKAGGKKVNSEYEPNMLAKIFDYPVTKEVDYPKSVWEFLNSAPPGDSKSRRTQLVERWIADSNIPQFTTATHNAQLDVLTGSVAHRKGLSLDVLNTRHVMLNQLSAEVFKMKRMLMELSMAVRGEKQV